MKEDIKEYLDWKGIHSPKASITYKNWLEYLVDFCGEKRLEEYRITDITNYQMWLKDHYASYTLEYATVVLKNFFQYFRDQNRNCLSPSLIKRKKGSPKSHRAIEETEFQKIVSVIPQDDFRSLRDLLIIRLLWDTGVRVSELCDLDVSQINSNKSETVIATKKTTHKRIIVWSQETHQLLMKYIAMRNELHFQNGASALLVGQHFNQGWNTRLTTRSVERIIKEYSKMAGIVEKITPHSFRHAWAHDKRDQNAPLSFIQKGLGHLSPVSTFVYEQYTDNDFVRNAKAYLNHQPQNA